MCVDLGGVHGGLSDSTKSAQCDIVQQHMGARHVARGVGGTGPNFGGRHEAQQGIKVLVFFGHGVDSLEERQAGNAVALARGQFDIHRASGMHCKNGDLLHFAEYVHGLGLSDLWGFHKQTGSDVMVLHSVFSCGV